jgi:hypothetical protein
VRSIRFDLAGGKINKIVVKGAPLTTGEIREIVSYLTDLAAFKERLAVQR